MVTGAFAALAVDKCIAGIEVLRLAMLAGMADTSLPSNSVPASHPLVRAPFVVVGEGGVGG